MITSVRSMIVTLVICLSALIVGCASVPVVRAWRPWLQTNREPRDIPLHSTLNIKVAGETQPLVGDEGLRESSVKKELASLLQRRGFATTDSAADFTVTLKYKTAERETIDMSTWNSATLGSATGLFSGGAQGRSWSVALASAIAGQAMSVIAGSRLRKGTMFTQVVALEFTDSLGDVFWTSDAMWDSESPDLLGDLTPALQTILVKLPSDSQMIPQVPMVEESREANYRRLYTDGKWFSCPALPYRVTIPNWHKPTDPWSSGYSPNEIESPVALAAFVDLIQTAEFSVPRWSDKLDDPMAPALWSRVTLGGTYRLLPSDSLVRVLIKLKGNREGYRAEKCWVATDKEYVQFLQQLSEWKQAVADYADVFKKQ